MYRSWRSKMKKRIGKKTPARTKTKIARHPKRKTVTGHGPNTQPRNYVLEGHPEL